MLARPARHRRRRSRRPRAARRRRAASRRSRTRSTSPAARRARRRRRPPRPRGCSAVAMFSDFSARALSLDARDAETVGHASEDSLAPMSRTPAEILGSAKTIALVGASPNPMRPSNRVMRYLLEQGYDVRPVRPLVREVLGVPCVATLAEIDEPIDLVDVFRRADACPDVAREAVERGREGACGSSSGSSRRRRGASPRRAGSSTSRTAARRSSTSPSSSRRRPRRSGAARSSRSR